MSHTSSTSLAPTRRKLCTDAPLAASSSNNSLVCHVVQNWRIWLHWNFWNLSGVSLRGIVSIDKVNELNVGDDVRIGVEGVRFIFCDLFEVGRPTLIRGFEQTEKKCVVGKPTEHKGKTIRPLLVRLAPLHPSKKHTLTRTTHLHFYTHLHRLSHTFHTHFLFHEHNTHTLFITHALSGLQHVRNNRTPAFTESGPPHCRFSRPMQASIVVLGNPRTLQLTRMARGTRNCHAINKV